MIVKCIQNMHAFVTRGNFRACENLLKCISQQTPKTFFIISPHHHHDLHLVFVVHISSYAALMMSMPFFPSREYVFIIFISSHRWHASVLLKNLTLENVCLKKSESVVWFSLTCILMSIKRSELNDWSAITSS